MQRLTTECRARVPEMIISGGQTGVDRAALDWAIEHAVLHSGWCPRGRIALDGPLPDRYALNESESAGYSLRTRYNVRDADATLIVNRGELTGGSKLTQRIAQKTGKPLFVAALENDWATQIDLVHRWLLLNRVLTLNVAGPSESRAPGIYCQTLDFLNQFFPEHQSCWAP